MISEYRMQHIVVPAGDNILMPDENHLETDIQEVMKNVRGDSLEVPGMMPEQEQKRHHPGMPLRRCYSA